MTWGERTPSLALRLRTLGFPAARLIIQLNLAIDQNSLARFSTRTVQRWSKTFHAAHACYRLVSGSFHFPSSLLFNFRSRYYCTIGLRMYLELEVHASQIHARYPAHVTRDTRNLLRFTSTGLSPSAAGRSRRSSSSPARSARVQNATSPTAFAAGFGLPFAAFDRLYLRHLD